MKENVPFDEQKHQNNEFDLDEREARQGDRRREPSDGYAYISMVGWFDRREQIRRKDDDYSS